MTDRADLLELIDLAPGPLRTVQTTWTSWTHCERSEAAQERAYGRPRLQFSAGPGPTILEGRRDIWFELPDRWRVVSDGPPLNFNTLEITDGHTIWSGTDGRLRSNDRSRPMLVTTSPLPDELYPARLISSLRLGDPEAGERDGRRVWTVLAHDRVDPGHLPPSTEMIPGAERVLIFDADTGILVSTQAFFDGEVCSRSELTGLVVNEPLDPALFTPSPGDATLIVTETEQQLAILDANGVDTGDLDRADDDAVYEAFTAWTQTAFRPHDGPGPPPPPPQWPDLTAPPPG